jgi:hypothetical protein
VGGVRTYRGVIGVFFLFCYGFLFLVTNFLVAFTVYTPPSSSECCLPAGGGQTVGPKKVQMEYCDIACCIYIFLALDTALKERMQLQVCNFVSRDIAFKTRSRKNNDAVSIFTPPSTLCCCCKRLLCQ